MTSLNLEPALRLLAHLAPARTAVLGTGELLRRLDRDWSEPPSPADVAALVSGRVPLAVEVLNYEPAFDDAEETLARPPSVVAAETEALLLAAYPATLPEIAREILGQIAVTFADGDLARLTVAAEPGGPALDEIHLIYRNWDGGTITVSLTGPTPSEPDPVALLTDVAEVLGEYVWLNNNDRLDIGVKTETHPLGPVTDGAFRAWWRASATSEALLTELWDEEPAAELLSEAALAGFVAHFAEENLANARSGAWAQEQIGDYDHDEDPQPRFPGDRLVELLTADLFDRAAALAGGPHLIYAIGPAHASEYGLVATVIFAGPERVVALAIDSGV